MRLSRRPTRRGASLVEAGFVIVPFVVLILMMIDLSVAMFRLNLITAAARAGARQVILHGQWADPGTGGPWGPANPYPGTDDYVVRADQSRDPLVQAVRPFLLRPPDPTESDRRPRSLVGPLDRVVIRAEWLDANDADFANYVGKPIRVTVSVPFQTIFGPVVELRAYSLMNVVH